MELDDYEATRIVDAKDEFDARARERGLMGLSSFAWARPGTGMLASAMQGTTNEYSGGYLEPQSLFPGGNARPRMCIPQQTQHRMYADGWRIRPGAKAMQRPTMLQQKQRMPFRTATSGITTASADLYTSTLKQQLTQRQADIVSNGWGEVPGEATGTTTGANPVIPRVQSALPGSAPTLPATGQPGSVYSEPLIAAVDDNIRAVESALQRGMPAEADTAVQTLASSVFKVAATAPPHILEEWMGQLHSLVSNRKLSQPSQSRMQLLEETVRLQSAFAKHGLSGSRRETLRKTILAELKTNPAVTVTVLQADAAALAAAPVQEGIAHVPNPVVPIRNGAVVDPAVNEVQEGIAHVPNPVVPLRNDAVVDPAINAAQDTDEHVINDTVVPPPATHNYTDLQVILNNRSEFGAQMHPLLIHPEDDIKYNSLIRILNIFFMMLHDDDIGAWSRINTK